MFNSELGKKQMESLIQEDYSPMDNFQRVRQSDGGRHTVSNGTMENSRI
jgi:hypothetical protein